MSDRKKSFFYIDRDGLVARFPQVHAHAETELLFQRTLRVPDNEKAYRLPAGLGHFPLRHLEDFAEALPPAWVDRGGVIMPMYRAEAMWIAFAPRYPCAIKIGAGKVNVLNGKPWAFKLNHSEQDYLVAPPQAALDGFCTGKDEVRQFVAVPLGREEQLVYQSDHGGIQIIVYPMKKGRYEQLRAEWAQGGGGGFEEEGDHLAGYTSRLAAGPKPLAVALAAGGRMSERIVADPYGADAWDHSAWISCFITLVDAQHWSRVTGAAPPGLPFTREDYERERLPWFEYYDEDLPGLEGDPGLAAAKSPARIAAGGGLQVLPAADDISPGKVEQLRLVRTPGRSRHPKPIVRTYWTVHDKLLRRRPRG